MTSDKPEGGLQRLLPSQTSERTKLSDTLTLDIKLPEKKYNTFLFRPRSLWSVVIIVLTN